MCKRAKRNLQSALEVAVVTRFRDPYAVPGQLHSEPYNLMAGRVALSGYSWHSGVRLLLSAATSAVSQWQQSTVGSFLWCVGITL